ncbi:MAG: sulfur carrier protein ThiS [Bacteroidetes bacterium]|nr:sulfur carrier protein ThiS [Bacteroidota bacterium]
MNIYVNDEAKEIPGSTNIETLVHSFEFKRQKGIAVAVDNQVITRDLWPQYYIKENAKVVVITATQGG